MKRLWKIAVCVAACMAFNASLSAAGPLVPNVNTLKKRAMTAGIQAATPAPAPAKNPLPDNPYSTIVVRNIFGLIPPAPPPDPNANKDAGLPKITPAGIMGEFGNWQVLFKVSPAQPVAGAKDEFYTLSEGQRQDDIEVVKIDDQKSLVTFDNHGTTQMLPLSDAPSGGAPATPSLPGMGNPGMMPGASGAGGGNNGPGGFTRFGGGGNNGGTPNGTSGINGGGGNDANGANGGMDFGDSTQNRVYQPPASNLTPEETAILIEAQRAALMNDPHPAYPPGLLPPTPLTKYNTSDGSGPPAP